MLTSRDTLIARLPIDAQLKLQKMVDDNEACAAAATGTLERLTHFRGVVSRLEHDLGQMRVPVARSAYERLSPTEFRFAGDAPREAAERERAIRMLADQQPGHGKKSG